MMISLARSFDQRSQSSLALTKEERREEECRLDMTNYARCLDSIKDASHHSPRRMQLTPAETCTAKAESTTVTYSWKDWKEGHVMARRGADDISPLVHKCV